MLYLFGIIFVSPKEDFIDIEGRKIVCEQMNGEKEEGPIEFEYFTVTLIKFTKEEGKPIDRVSEPLFDFHVIRHNSSKLL